MTRLIDADALNAEMYRKSFEVDDGRNIWNSGLWIRYKIFEEAIRDAPTIDAVPVVHGHWKINYLDDTKVNRKYAHIICSECKADIAHDWEGKLLLKTTLNYNYCPNCGARMKGEQDG